MSYGVILISVTIVWLISLYKYNFELLAPASLFQLGIVTSCFLAVIGKESWNPVNEVSITTVQIIVIGCIAFAVGCYIATVLVKKLPYGKLKEPRAKSEAKLARAVRFEAAKYGIFYAIIIFAIILRILETLQIAENLGLTTGNYFEATRLVRDETAVFNSAESIRLGVGFSFLERQMEKIAVALGYVSVYLLAVGFTKKHSLKEIVPSVGLLGLSGAFILSTGSRSTILFYVVAFIACYSLLSIKNGVSSRLVSLRVAIFGIIAAIIGSLAFYFMGGLVGRSTSSNIVRYVSFYFGSGVPALQQLIEGGALEMTVPGLRSFYYAFSLLYKLGIVDNFPGYSLGWINLGGLDCNVFTGFARYYLDFGMVGVVILSMLAGLILSLMYLIARTTFSPTWILVVGYLTPRFFDMAREEFVFSRLLSSTQLVSILIMVAILAFYYYEPRQGAAYLLRKK